MQQQAGGIDTHLQQTGFTGTRQHGLYHMLHLGERTDVHQVAIRGLLSEILLAITGQTLGIDEALLQLQRLPIGLMDDEAVEDGSTDSQP